MGLISAELLNLPREFLKPGLVVSLLSVWVLVGLFFYLNVYTRRRYFTIWSAAWMFYGLWLTLCLTVHEVGPSPLLGMFKQVCVGTAATFMIWGASVFLKQPAPDRLFGLFLTFLVVWSYLGAYHTDGGLIVQSPVFALIGLGSGLTAYGFYGFRRRCHYVGATLLTLGFALWGAYLASYPFWELSERHVTAGFFLSATLQLFIAVSMIVLVLEEARTTHEQALRQIEEHKSESEGLRSRVQSTEERYRVLFAQASEGIIITAASDLRILELNDTALRLLGLSAVNADNPTLLSQCLRLVSSDAQPPRTGSEWFAALMEQHRVEVIRPDGTIIPAEVGGAPVNVEGDTAYQFFFREVTERARLEQQLRQAEKLSALGQMISGVAHELNNPLAVVKGYLDLILSRHDVPDQTRTDLEKVAHESNRAAKLVNNFLSFARQQPSSQQAVDVNQLVQRVVELREVEMRLMGLQPVVELDLTLSPTHADGAGLEQVLVNLISNAVHALSEWPGPRQLKISTCEVDDVIQIRVADSGPGIPAAVVPHIFEPFFTTKPVGSGTGLGLSIAHSIIAEHHGRISYEPAPEGGAAFLIELPVVFVESLVPSEAESFEFAPAVPAPADLAARILVVDDERALAELLGELLSVLGHEPVICCSPQQALELIEERSFDVILSDFRMPLMNGQQFYERVSERHPDLARRMGFLTGDVVAADTRAFLESVGNPHLRKPFRLDAVAKLVSDLLLEAEVVEV